MDRTGGNSSTRSFGRQVLLTRCPVCGAKIDIDQLA